MTRVAFLGLGAIGAPMAKHLAQPPFELAVWNRTASRARTFAFSVGTGVRVAKSPADAARGAEFVVTCLPVRSAWANCLMHRIWFVLFVSIQAIISPLKWLLILKCIHKQTALIEIFNTLSKKPMPVPMPL